MIEETKDATARGSTHLRASGAFLPGTDLVKAPSVLEYCKPWMTIIAFWNYARHGSPSCARPTTY